MQRARSAVLALATLVVACSPPQNPRTTAGPSTPGRDDVATRDDEDDAPAPTEGAPIGPSGNRRIRTFDEAKRHLRQIYGARDDKTSRDRATDLYCGCPFAPAGHTLVVDLGACGYVPHGDRARAERIEWEHAVPAAAFGRSFAEWSEGSPRCVDRKGRSFRGRRCARTSAEFSRMEADLHNLFPVVGEVNGLRSDLPMGVLDPPGRSRRRATTEVLRFGACKSTIEAGVFLPRPEVRGDLARAYKYMDRAYPGRGVLDDAHRALFDAWDREDPPDAWERERNRLVAERQGNPNELIAEPQK